MFYKLLFYKRNILVFFLLTCINLNSAETNNFYQEEFCASIEPSNFRNYKIPSEIIIETKDSKKWASNLFRLILDSNSNFYKTNNTDWYTFQIEKKYKKKFKSEVLFLFKNPNYNCKSKAKIQITGNLWWHLEWANGYPFASMKVNLDNGHLNNNVTFKLLLPNARSDYRKNINLELYITTLFNKLSVLAPNSYLVDVKVNGNKYSKYLLQEDLSKEFLESRGLVEGPLLEGDQRFTTEKYSSHQWRGELGLAKIINSSYSVREKPNTQISFYALSLLNNIFIDSDDDTKEQRRCHNNIVTIDKNKFFKDNNEVAINQIYEALIYATETYHSFTCDDRKFYFDPIKKILLPIYNDGKSTLDYNNTDYELDKPTLNAIEGSLKTLELINKLDDKIFYSELVERGFELNFNDFTKIKKKIVNNLIYLSKQIKPEIKKSKLDYFYDINPNYFGKEIKLIFFDDKKNIIEICDFKKENCEKKKIENNIKEFHKYLLSQNFSKLIEKEILSDKYEYLFLSINKNYSSTHEIFAYNKDNNFRKVNIDDEFMILHNDFIKVNFDKKKKIINFLLINQKGRVKIFGKNIKDWSFILETDEYFLKNKKKIVPTKDFDMLTGCITFIDVNLKNINIFAKNSLCEDTVNFIRTTGNISNMVIIDSISDGVDFDFSNILVNSLTVDGAKNDCLDLSYGKYEIISAIINNCGDKGISLGEKSNLLLKNGVITDADIGIASKDSSMADIIKVNIKSNVCLAAYRKKQEFSGGIINYKNLSCFGKPSINQRGSIIKKDES